MACSLIEASYEDIKSSYDDEWTFAHPNAVSGTLDALEARFGIPVIYTSRYRQLAEERAASWLSKHFTYWYLEENGYGRCCRKGICRNCQKLLTFYAERAGMLDKHR